MLLLPLLTVALATSLGPGAGAAAELASVPARATSGAAAAPFDGAVEAVRQTTVAAQVAGAVVQLQVRVGDRVAAGQMLLRIDARAAEQNAAAGAAQVQAARAALEVAEKDFERQKQLFQKNYISQAALDRAESEFKATRAQLTAQMAQSDAAHTQSGFYVVKAPFSGVVSEVPVSLGDMAMPGRALLTLYDPSALRITASVPQTVASFLVSGQPARAELPGLPEAASRLTLAHLQVLPTVDPATHSVQLRGDLPAGIPGVAPGMFARLWLPLIASQAGAGISVSVPARSVVRRAEMTGLYVLDLNGRPLLRQVRLGPAAGDEVEILAGVAAGERVVTDPQAAARVAAAGR